MEHFLNFLNSIQALDENELDVIRKISTEQSLSRNEELQPVGHTCRTIYFVSSGMLRIWYLKDGTDITESFEPENAIVARAESLFAGVPSKKAIQAVEDSQLIAVSAPKLFDLFDSHPAIERMFRRIIEQQYVKTIQRIESLQFQTPEERYRQLITTQPDMLKRVPLKFIASYLGITQVSLSRIRSRK
ncbi:MAG: Crp/Fnr family transcriptional regulator [Flavobacteriia bacterium]